MSGPAGGRAGLGLKRAAEGGRRSMVGARRIRLSAPELPPAEGGAEIPRHWSRPRCCVTEPLGRPLLVSFEPPGSAPRRLAMLHMQVVRCGGARPTSQNVCRQDR